MLEKLGFKWLYVSDVRVISRHREDARVEEKLFLPRTRERGLWVKGNISRRILYRPNDRK
jgi:hypothetical protein